MTYVRFDMDTAYMKNPEGSLLVNGTKPTSRAHPIFRGECYNCYSIVMSLAQMF